MAVVFFSVFFCDVASVAVVDSVSVVDSVVLTLVRNELESDRSAVKDLVIAPPPCKGQIGSDELRE